MRETSHRRFAIGLLGRMIPMQIISIFSMIFSMLVIFNFPLGFAENSPLTSLTYPNQPHHFTLIDDAKRFQTLTKEIRCVVCQNQTIADSNAPLANDLREKVYKMVIEKKSNEEIKNYLVKRYGEFILLKPRFNKLTLLLWAFPFIGLACILPFLLFLRSSKT